MTQPTDPRPASPVGGEALLPCPFCGNDVRKQSFWYGTKNGASYHVFCLDCSDVEAMCGPFRDTLEDAVSAWNTRAALSAPSVTGEAVERAGLWANLPDDKSIGSMGALDAFEAGKRAAVEAILAALSPTALEQGSGAFPAKEPVIPTELEDGAVVGHMVSRFLAWRLPENFAPDNGITFKATFNDHMNPPMRCNPTGTNLLDRTQAEAMVRHMLEGLLK